MSRSLSDQVQEASDSVENALRARLNVAQDSTDSFGHLIGVVTKVQSLPNVLGKDLRDYVAKVHRVQESKGSLEQSSVDDILKSTKIILDDLKRYWIV